MLHAPAPKSSSRAEIWIVSFFMILILRVLNQTIGPDAGDRAVILAVVECGRVAAGHIDPHENVLRGRHTQVENR
ncbi:hypothetical protein D3C87_2008650 [compost metagenome]